MKDIFIRNFNKNLNTANSVIFFTNIVRDEQIHRRTFFSKKGRSRFVMQNSPVELLIGEYQLT